MVGFVAPDLRGLNPPCPNVMPVKTEMDSRLRGNDGPHYYCHSRVMERA